MNETTLSKSKLTFSKLGLGTNSIGGHNIYAGIDESISKEIVKEYLLKGGTFIDTAYFYGLGRSEELIGEVLQELKCKNNITIATKASFVVGEDRTFHDNSPRFLVQSVKESLKRLQTNSIGIFYIHSPDEITPKDQAVKALKELKDQGLIKAIGVSNFSLEQLKEANKDGYVDIVQDRYNLFSQGINKEYIDYLKSNDIGFVPYSPLASGILTGKYSLDSELSERQRRHPIFAKENYAENLNKIETLKEISLEKGCDVSSIALAWLLSLDFVSAIIPGAKNPEQVNKNMISDQIQLTNKDIEKINKRFDIK